MCVYPLTINTLAVPAHQRAHDDFLGSVGGEGGVRGRAESWVDLDQIHGAQVTSSPHGLHHRQALPQRQSTTH